MNKTLNFKNTPGLGNVVKNVKVFCKLTKEMETITPKYIIGDFANPLYHGLAGHKFSRLCGFTFESNIPGIQHPMFQIVYVPKLRATLTRNDKALSGWYCWEVISVDNKKIRSIQDMKAIYGFDVTAFFHCDLFEKYLPLFKSNVNYVLNNQIHKLVDSIQDLAEKNELTFYVNAIASSINDIGKVQYYISYVDNEKIKTTADDPNAVANLAYNANKTYRLKELDKKHPKQPSLKATDVKDAKPSNSKQSTSDSKDKIKYDPSLKYKFGGGRTKKSDNEIFDKYDDYDNDDY